MKESELNGYDLFRMFFDWCFENPDLINPNHIAIYSFIIEHCNRLGWKDKFGLPTGMTMEAVGIKNYRTFAKSFFDLVDWGFIKVIQKSKNQYSANVIALVKNTKANTKALTKASIKHVSKHVPKQVQSTVDVNKPMKHLTNETIKKFDFFNSLIEIGVSEKIAIEWIKVRKDKKASNTETAFDKVKREIEKSGIEANECIKIAVEKSWRGFEYEWIKNLNHGKNNEHSSIGEKQDFLKAVASGIGRAEHQRNNPVQ
jgi:hypothetical protein